MADLKASDVLGIDWAARARDILERNGTPVPRDFSRTSIGPRGPRILEDHDLRSPDQVAADIILGRGTGRTVEDILTGLTPLPGAITEARGGESGVLDWVPGGTVLKGAVLATPRIAQIVRNTAGRVKADDAIDAIYQASQNAINRLARESSTPPTFDALSTAIKNEIAQLGEINNPEQIERLANEYAQSAMLRSIHNLEDGLAPALNVKMDPLVNVGYNAVQEVPTSVKKARNVKSATEYRKRNMEAFEGFPEETKAEIERIANEARQAAREEAAARGITDSKKINEFAQSRYQSTKLREISRVVKEHNVSEPTQILPVRTFSDNVEAENAIADYAASVWREATAQARAAGLSESEINRAGNIARDRARKAKAKEMGGEVWAARQTAANNAQQNLRYIYSILSPELKKEVDEAALKEAATKNGKTVGSVLQSLKFKHMRKLIQGMGFRSPNDLDINNYSQLGRTPSEHILKPGGIPLGTPAKPSPSSILGGALDITDNDRMMQSAYDAGLAERPLMAADRPVQYEGPASRILSAQPAPRPARLLPESEYSDADIAELLVGYGEQPTADAAFNREYAEMLMKEQGY